VLFDQPLDQGHVTTAVPFGNCLATDIRVGDVQPRHVLCSIWTHRHTESAHSRVDLVDISPLHQKAISGATVARQNSVSDEAIANTRQYRDFTKPVRQHKCCT